MVDTRLPGIHRLIPDGSVVFRMLSGMRHAEAAARGRHGRCDHPGRHGGVPPMLGVAVVRQSRKWWIALGTCVLVVFGFIVYASM
jgi:hypothetical protein